MTTHNVPLTNDQLMTLAPSVFASEAWGEMSDRYTFIPTIDVVDKMRAEGFQPFSAAQSRTRIDERRGFTKHLIRFRDMRTAENPALAHLGGLFPEVVLTNSHDGASCYKLNAGIFRCVCINGLIAGESYGQMNVRHTGSADGVIDATFELVNEFPKLLAAAESFSRLQLTAPQQQAYASAALELKYDDETPAPILPAQLVRPRRHADTSPNLWNTFNVVQEHLVGGGVRGRNPETRRRLTTRPVTGISENTKLNKALWTLTEKMRELVA